jgi:ribosomal protein L7Ae-like RNA K-turn-binding protein
VDKLLNLIGLAKKAGKLELGEEPVGAAARARQARLLLLASDAADNTRRRAKHFSEAGECVCLSIEATKEALGKALGRTSCAMLAITDIGFAEAVAKKLAEGDEARYGEAAERLALKARRAAERRRELARHEKNVRMGKKKPRKEPDAAPAGKTATGKARTEENKPPRRNVKHGRTRAEREKARRAAEKARRTGRFARSRPVKKGKGSVRKEVRRTSQHTEVQ